MYLARRNCVIINQLRCFSAQATASDYRADVIEENWKTAKPYSDIPSPSAFKLLFSFLPGGRFNSVPLSVIHENLKKEYGSIYKLKGAFGKRDALILHDPKDYEIVFRTEGNFPMRRLFDTIAYYRKEHRKDRFAKSAGLLNEHGQAWWDLRHKVNGVMMKPQITKGYTTTVDEVASDFVKKLHNLRDSNLDTPSDLLYQLNLWALESISYITMNVRMGLLTGKPDESVVKFTQNLKILFDLLFQLEFLPSIWKVYKTPKFNKFLQIMDELHDTIEKFVEIGLANLKENSADKKSNSREESVLEKLYAIDKDIAFLMAMDSILGGVDSTAVATFSILYNLAQNKEKQDILRSELLKILPEKDSPLTIENMSNLPYLRACIKEGMRIMPVIGGNLRTTGQNIVIKGYQVPKETDVLMPGELFYKNDYYFPEAKSFRPERWLRSVEKHENYNPFTYIPFGFGSRNCVGRRFAEMEIECLVTRLVRNYHLEWHQPPPKIRSTTINIPYGDLRLRLKEY
ncbi:probable cytochrome P450 12b2, mitochondrial isoform X2 [Phlebotomus papatasi]|uniref:probable cytochrome P450 12b2, mitochondrial isoform X2 n=1 Tax=Phlebotomus papatasi TaxID=29031 RepID=UPI002484600E|nr:probable cytochrome P450 12b2, mitochondrial isoform X2 [Phlebotomus papatasi]